VLSVFRYEVRTAWRRRGERKIYLSIGSVGLLFAIEVVNAIFNQLKMPRLHPTVKLELRDSGSLIYARIGSSDLDAIRLIFEENEYLPLTRVENVSVIVDLGANAGYSSVYFLDRFPEASAIAVEPDPRNLEICRRNLAPYAGRVTLLEGAVWSRRSHLALVPGKYRDRREWSTQVTDSAESGSTRIVAYDMPYLIEMAPRNHIDILKIDIERSELEVFGSVPADWLDSVGNIAIELHDRECEEVFYRALEPYAFSALRSGELTVVSDLKRLGFGSNDLEACNRTSISRVMK
jgi:FkbM family methyltransferase